MATLATAIHYETEEKAIEELEERIEQIREQERQSQLLHQQLTGQIEVLKEQIRAQEDQEVRLKERKSVIESELSRKEKQRKAEEQAFLLAKEKQEQVSLTEADYRLEADATTAMLSHLEMQIEDGKNEIISLLNQRASVKGNVQRYDTMQEQMQIRKAEVTGKLLRIGSEDARWQETLQEYQTAYETVSEEIEKQLRKSKEQEDKIEQLQQKLAGQNRELEQKQSFYHREKSRLETLSNLTERYDGYGNSIRKVMEQKDKNPGILGVVADLIKVESSYETAIETALGGSIQNIVTDREETAKRMIEFLKRGKYGRATFLPLTAIGRKGNAGNKDAVKEPGILGVASTLVRTEEKYRALVEYLLGRTLVADNMDHAIAAARKYHHSLRIVTLEGESLSPGGSMTGGAYRNSSNLLGRRREV